MNFESLEIYVERLEVKPDIIVCTETWNLDCVQYYKLSNYNVYYNSSANNRADGVVLYIKDHLVENTEIESFGKVNILSTSIRLTQGVVFKVSAIYRCHDIEKGAFTEQFRSFIESNKKVNNHCIIGDFNIDILKMDYINQDFLSQLLQFEYVPFFNGVTRPSQDNIEMGSCIDNMFVKTKMLNTRSYKIMDVFTDHYPLVLEINTNACYPQVDGWTSEINYRKLTSEVNKLQWNNILQIKDPNLATNCFIEMLQIAQNKATHKRKKNGNKYAPRKKWITRGIMISCSTKETLYNLWKKKPTRESFKADYKNYVKVLNRVIKRAKLNYESAMVQNFYGNNKLLWKYIQRKIRPNVKTNPNEISFLMDNDVKIENPREMANLFNSYFCNVGSNLAKNIEKPQGASLNLPKMNRNSIYIKLTDPHEIRAIINQLKEKCGGVDGIHVKIIKSIADKIIEPLSHIFNLSINTSIWPNALKTAVVVPIYKAGVKHNPINYRPISLISNIAKIFEKIIHSRLYNFVEKHKLISEHQYGFVKGKGTKDALNFLSNTIYNNLDLSLPITVTFLDLAKAFDTVNHEILLKKLYHYGIRGMAHDLIRSYLNNRIQTVKIASTVSAPKQITCGVPQGTILGPLLFILYINDMLQIMEKQSVMSYADDTAIISTEETWDKTQNKMNDLLKTVSTWLALNQLSLNISKTVFMTFGVYRDSIPNNVTININHGRVKRVEFCKYLGIVFDCHMRWDKHVENVVKRTKYLLFMFAKLSRIMATGTLLTIYYALFHSICSYGVIAWGGAYDNVGILLQNLQNRILKIILKQQTNYSVPLNISQMFTLESLLHYYADMRKEHAESHSKTRNKNLLLPRINKRIKFKSSKITAMKAFNKLPGELKNLELRGKTLKKKFKGWIGSSDISAAII